MFWSGLAIGALVIAALAIAVLVWFFRGVHF